jgi:hypothetical protein
MTAPSFDYTDAIKALCTQFAAMTGLSEGPPNKVEESAMTFPVFDAAYELPYGVVETVGAMEIEQGGDLAILQVRNRLRLRVWYIRSCEPHAVVGDSLRADGELIAQTFWESTLSNMVEAVWPVSIDWSYEAEFNAAAKIAGWPAAAVAVTMDVVAVERR